MFNTPAYAMPLKGKYCVLFFALPKKKWATVKTCFIDIKTPPPLKPVPALWILGKCVFMRMYQGNSFLVASLPLNILALESGCPSDWWHRIIKSVINNWDFIIRFYNELCIRSNQGYQVAESFDVPEKASMTNLFIVCMYIGIWKIKVFKENIF